MRMHHNQKDESMDDIPEAKAGKLIPDKGKLMQRKYYLGNKSTSDEEWTLRVRSP
jgi:hypothetical protein